MGRTCIVANCGNSDRDKNTKWSLYSLPPDSADKQKWLDFFEQNGGLRKNVKMGGSTISWVCEVHFEPSCFTFGFTGKKRRLIDGAIPSIPAKKKKGRNKFSE